MWVPRTRTILPVIFLVFVFSSSRTDSTALSPPTSKLKVAAVFPHLGKSHFDVFQPLLEELARRGHDVTVISYFPRTEKAKSAEPLPTYRDISLVEKTTTVFLNVVDLNMIDHGMVKTVKELLLLNYMATVACDAILNNTRVRDFVESGEKFDVVLSENFNTNCFMILLHKLNAPVIDMSTHQLMPWASDQLGISDEASYIPTMFSTLPRPMNFLQRTWNVLVNAGVRAVYDTYYHWCDQSTAEKAFGPGIPSVRAIRENTTLMLVNTHYSLHGATSKPPNVVEIGGIHIPPKPKPLPKDIQKFLDEGREGVLYFNLGSMVKMSSMPREKLEVLLKVLGSIPRKVIWKWETDDVPRKLDNVMIKKWLPQFDIINHPNVKCYFGHGGLLGLSEGVHSGVPMVLMPLYGDQYHNSIAAQARGVAKVLMYADLSEQTLRDALDEVFNDTRYYENAQKLSRAYRDRPATALETAVWWTEYVARGHGLPYLKSEGQKMPWYQRNLIDVAAFLLALSLLAVYAVYRMMEPRRRPKNGRRRLASKKRD